MMKNTSLETATSPADATEPDVDTAEQDPAGGITLTGRSRVGAGARVLAGMVLTAGIVAVVNGSDTVSSIHYANNLL